MFYINISVFVIDLNIYKLITRSSLNSFYLKQVKVMKQKLFVF